MANQPFQVIVTFNRVGDPRFSVQAESIVTALTSEPMLTLLPNPIHPSYPSRVALQQALDDYLDATYRAKNIKSAIKERNQKRKVLEQMLKDLAPLLECTAKYANDITILIRSGYDLRRPSVKHRYGGIPAAPIITVKRGPVSGSLAIRVNPLLPGHVAYQAESAVGESKLNANFQLGVTSNTGSCILLTDLTVAQWHQIRVRGVGSQGPGDWSAPVGIIVT